MVSLDWGSMRHMKDAQLRQTTDPILILPIDKTDVQHRQSIVTGSKDERGFNRINGYVEVGGVLRWVNLISVL